jgi:hypothetical protein
LIQKQEWTVVPDIRILTGIAASLPVPWQAADRRGDTPSVFRHNVIYRELQRALTWKNGFPSSYKFQLFIMTVLYPFSWVMSRVIPDYKPAAQQEAYLPIYEFFFDLLNIFHTL